jgi:hypothetical protein
MLRDYVWFKLARDEDILCAECMFERAHQRDVTINIDDLRLCGFNVPEWLDAAMMGDGPPEDIDGWLSMLAQVFVATRRPQDKDRIVTLMRRLARELRRRDGGIITNDNLASNGGER